MEIGDKFGLMTVVEMFKENGMLKCRCICDCGEIKTVRKCHLESGGIKSCGCLRRRTSSEKCIKDLSWQRFGKLIVTDRKINKNGSYYWVCKCDCGNEKVIRGAHLSAGKTKSCGCLFNEAISKPDSALKRTYRAYTNGAKQREYEFEIPIDKFIELTQMPCHYCGDTPSNKSITASGVFLYNGLDRVDNSKGYLISNVVPCCNICNRAKNKLSYEDFIEWIKRLSNKRQGE